MRVLLVNPWIYDFKCHDFWIKPLGLLKLSSFLRQNNINISMIDCMERYAAAAGAPGRFGRGKFDSEELIKPGAYKIVPRSYKRYGITPGCFMEKMELSGEPDIIIATSNMTYTYEGVLLAIKLLKKRFPGTIIILGGIYATLCHEHAEKKSGADFVWKGGINREFIKFFNSLGGFKLPEISSEEFEEILPDYSFYPDTPYAAVRFSAGCPFECTYCSIKQFHEGFYRRKEENVLLELEKYTKAGIKNIALYDDALLYENGHIKSLLKKITALKSKFYFHTPNGLHAAYIDDELAELMKQAGFVDIRLSLESSDHEIQKKTGGKIHNERFEGAVKSLRKAGFSGSETGVYVLTGLPGVNFDSTAADVSYLEGAGLKIKPAYYSPIPGTADFMRIKADLRNILIHEPLCQNEFYFMRVNLDYTWDNNEKIRQRIRRHNAALAEKEMST